MKLWKGRFTKTSTSSSDEFNASIPFDHRLYEEDIAGSIAHAAMLGRQGILTDQEAEAIIRGLADILADIRLGNVQFTIEREDIHMNVEALLTERIGDLGKKLHTARSRNDQVALDFRLHIKKETAALDDLLTGLLSLLVEMAEEHVETIMPGYTHLQRAQPVTFGFHLMAYAQMFARDRDRFRDSLKRTDVLPLGSGALSGTTYPTDREFLAASLGFSKVSQNAMDSVSDRDFALEFLAACAICMMHLSRFCEELILWSSSEFAFIEMDDAYATGSSIMPQKKNPDMAELIRGKTGRVYGDLTALLTIMKGLPLAYNKDMQEDKLPVFDAGDTLKQSLEIFTEMLGSVAIRKEAMSSAAKSGFLNATDAADYLVRKGIAFRDCHEIIGRMVLACIRDGKALEDLTLDELQGFSPAFGEDVYRQLNLEAVVNSKISQGSTSFESVKKQIADFRRDML